MFKFLISKCRDGSDVVVCITSRPARRIPLHGGDLVLKYTFGRKICKFGSGFSKKCVFPAFWDA